MKTYIWTLPTRVFHSCLVIFTIITFLSADDDFLKLHSIFGYGIGILILFRLTWGKMGPKYSNFKDFNFSIRKVLTFSKDLLLNKNHKTYAGHNPAASFILFCLIISLGFAVLSGLLALGEADKGYFKFLETSFFEDIHEFLSYLTLVFIFIHISGVIIDNFLHKKVGTLKSIINGYKNVDVQNIKLNFKQKIVSLLFFFLMLFIMYLTATDFDHLF